MSTLKYQANLANSTSQYNAYLGAGGFRGVDVSDDPSKINGTRFANATNMWKDYENQSGIAVETMPGYRKLKSTLTKINGIFRYVYNIGEVDEQRYVVVHCGGDLWVYTWQDFMNGNTEVHYVVSKGDSTIKNEKSNAFQYRNRFFILQNGYWELIRTESEIGAVSFSIQSVSVKGYIPTTFIDGKEYEQANAFSEKVINEYNDIASLKTTVESPSYKFPLYNYVKETPLSNGDAQQSSLEGGTWYYDNADWYEEIPRDKFCIVRITASDTSEFTFNFLYINNLAAITPDVRYKAFGVSPMQGLKGSTKYTIIFSMDTVPSDKAVTFSIKTTMADHFDIEVSTVDFDVTQDLGTSIKEPLDIYFVGDEGRTSTGTETGLFISPEVPSIANRVFEPTSIPAFEIVYIAKVNDTLTRTELPSDYSLSIKYNAKPVSFTSVGEYTPFSGSHDVSMADAINGCTLFDIFDDRIFLSGNPKLPNTIFYANRDNTGYVNPSYFGVLNWFDCGVSNEPITAMVHNANTLIVLKGNTIQDSVISFYTPWQTQQDIIPKAYIRSDGLPGKGCIGFACNLRDDIVFLSETGLEGIDRQTVNTERSIGHRSSLVDAKLLSEDLQNAMYCEWKDYLVILFPSGNAYMADTKQVSRINGYNQYEWYLLNDVFTWTNDTNAYHYATAFPESIIEDGEVTIDGKSAGVYVTITDNTLGQIDMCVIDAISDMPLPPKTSIYNEIQSVNVNRGNDADGNEIIVKYIGIPAETVGYTIDTPHTAYILLEKQEEKICIDTTSTNKPTFLTEFNGLMIFGTDNGDICVFNTDKRGVRPERLKDEYTEQEYKSKYSTTIDAEWYDRCGHAYLSGIETAFDNANIPHLTKDTIKKSCVVEVKLGITSSFSSQFRTDRDGWSEPSLVSIRNNDFSDNDLFKADFTTNSNAALAVTEKTKKWVVKQYRMYSDKWRTPFGIYGIAYRYSIHGRIKN